MRLTYRILAFIIVAEVAIQAAVMVYAIAGLGRWVQGGGVLDAAVMESEELAFDEIVGFIIHGMNGMFVMPVLALLLLIFSFFAKVRRAWIFALVILVLVVLQITLGITAGDAPFLGILHGLNAFAIAGTALWAGIRARKPVPETTPVPKYATP